MPSEAPSGRIVVAARAGDAYLYVAAENESGWTLRVPGYCDFVISRELQAVECRVDPTADVAFIAVLLAGLAIAFLLGLAGHTVLHASAVEVGGTAIAFVGASGSGKSTLAALLCVAGARLVTDDVLRVGMAPVPVCVGGSPQIRLRRGAAWVLEAGPAAPTTTVTVDDRLAVRPATTRPSSTVLSAIVLPRVSREASAIELIPVTGAAAFAELASACRVAGWEDPGLLRGQFATLARVAAGVRVIEALIPWGPESRAAIVPPLLALAR